MFYSQGAGEGDSAHRPEELRTGSHQGCWDTLSWDEEEGPSVEFLSPWAGDCHIAKSAGMGAERGVKGERVKQTELKETTKSLNAPSCFTQLSPPSLPPS